MSIQVALHHRTTYRYDRPVALGPQTIRLRPAPHCRSRILGYSLKVTPGEHFVNWQQDPQANWLARLVFPERTSSLEIDVALVAEMTAVNPFDFFLEPSAEMWPFAYDPAIAPDLAPYRRTLPGSPLFDAFVAGISRTPRATNHLIVELNQLVSQQIAYGVRLEAGLQTPEETLEKKGGSCRDSSWLLVQVLRQLGFATRFASGYLIQLTSDTKPLDDGAAGPTSDFVDLHAWCEVYLPGAGWIGLDPTSGLLAGEGHLPLACTADPSQAAPVSGLVESCNTTFEHEMTISRILETPRVTKPYTDRQWAAVLAAGQAIDRELEAADVRLTMGGEPTFVSIDDFDGDEWNIDAMGDAKKKLSVELHGRLKERYAPNGLVHFGQGKWYPGEPLPRWALNLFWRADGEALWTDASLVADESKPSGATEAQAAALLRGVAKRLGLDDRLVFPAFEDAPYYRWREGKLPSNVDAIDPKLDDALERDRLKKTFMAGIDAVIGHVLPVGRKHEVWRSGSWHFRNDRCFLVPGDSPIGLRLPLDSQPWIAPGDRDPIDVPDPSADHEELPSHDALLDGAKGKSDDARAPKKGESAKWVTRTAMCAEPRKGVLYVFMPPMEALDDYVILVAAVEAAAKEIGVPVLLEGYSPPRDPRVVSMSVTPDPGVIEVNVQPSKSWNELVDHTTHLYETARITRLSAEKFTVDGRHVGTGGGNHMVLGGATPEDSPFLRRPDLLRSIIAYFHQHPSLSYLFSGQFIGPTSQAPRLDEARNDAIAEIEIAFAEVTRKTGEQPPTPWLVDRLFRDLLTDVTGNTHRAELCIDKLYSPDGPAGRLGLLEMRAFEMPPHARMSLTQQLLLRSLVARFWKTPYAPERLARWGTELHDRFMLPFFVWQDFESVIADLRADGHAIELDWFRPHFEFRFPKYGDFVARELEVELRCALEPWHVMGESATATGTARYVDSSLERLQVKVKGMAPERFTITCNGRAIPLAPTGTNGEAVAGVRFRAWQPPRCLHPHIPVHAPLVFDVVDRWSKASLGGCEYHVTHPGGRSHETRPINAREAEGRLRARFSRTGHTAGRIEDVPAAKSNVDFPFTLDLRRS